MTELPPAMDIMPVKGEIFYESSFADQHAVKEWVMEGAGLLEFRDGWMHMHAHNWRWYHWFSNPGHHVFWCPAEIPDRFIAEWEAQNLEPDAGLCIVFFSAKGIHGEDIFDASLSKRNGDFKQYTKGEINCYHISYYANNPLSEPGRGSTNLRKNRGFHLVQTGLEGIPTASGAIHKMRLIKDGSRIVMFVDDRRIIDWTDDGEQYGRALAGGRIGLRQMRWSHFRYRDFKIWEIGEEQIIK